jgi:hypothetical protein
MALDPVSIGLSAGLSALQTGMGIVQTISGNSKLNALQKQRTAYQTPEEINKVLQLAMSNAQGDTQTRDFQLNQLDRAFSSSLGASQRLGADPNGISDLFSQKINGIMKIAESSHASRTEAIGQLFNAYNLVAENKAAEWRSKEDILKDQIQAAAGKVQAGYANMSGGFNTGLSAIEANAASNLYQTPQPTVTPKPTTK